MQRVIDEMAKAKDDVERRLRIHIPDIIKECLVFGYLGKKFTFDVSDLSDRVNARLIALSDDILSDIESRARKAAECAEEEEEWLPLILPYISRQIGEEDMVTRLDKHCSTLRYFLEGWIAIGMVNKLQEYEITNNVLRYIDNPLASPLWQEALNAGYLSAAISRGDYVFGKGNQRNVLKALTEVEQYAINEAFQYGRILHYGNTGAIGYIIHRGSFFDCPHCDSNCGFVIPLNDIRVPQHPRCVCWTEPIFSDGAALADSYELTYKKEKGQGILLTNKGRIAASKVNSNELQKFNKEQAMAKVLVDNNFIVQHLSEVPGVASGDLLVNGIHTEIKKLSSHNNIARHAKHSFEDKKIELLIFEFTQETDKIHKELLKLKQKNYRVKYWFTGRENSIFDL